MSHHPTRIGAGVVLGAIVAAALVLTLGASGAQAQAPQSSASVNVSLSEWSVAPDVASVQSGEITFVVSNAGSIAHELVIIAGGPAGALPLTEDGARVDEAQVAVVGEIEEFGAGLTSSGTLTLAPGTYSLICNVPAHYQAGMFTSFTVTAAPTEGGADGGDMVVLPTTGSGGLAPGSGGSGVDLLLLGLAAGAVIVVTGGAYLGFARRRTR